MNFRFTPALLALLATAGISRAQWFQTTYTLKGGWNAIYLHGEATYAAPDTLFPDNGSSANVQEVWRWNAKPNQMQFDKSPLIPSAGTPEWTVWKRGLPAESNLSLITGQTAYLVKCAGTAGDTYSVPLTQRALPPSALWVRSGANLLGFPTRQVTNYPSFSNYFQTFPAATTANAKIYKYAGGDLSPANPIQIFSPTLEQVDRNKAYWFEAEVVGNYYAPLEVSLSHITGIDFGRTGSVITARLRNNTTANMTVTLAPVASLAAPAGQDAITGEVPLTRRIFNTVTATWTETPVTTAYTEVIGANSGVELSFGVNRAAMAGASNALYASLLRLTDAGNLFEINLPVSARVASMAGLWVGAATVTNVTSQVQATATATAVLTNGVLTGIEVTGGGFGYGAVPVPVVAAPAGVRATATAALAPGVPATATATVTGGAVSAITLTNGGTGYGGAPVITVAAPASGITATATATLTNGSLTGISITNGGSGYAEAPAITIGAPGNIISGFTLTNPGSGYTIEPVVTIEAPGSGVAATAKATMKDGIITGLSPVFAGSGYTGAPEVTFPPPAASTVQAVATASISGGAVTGVSVTNTGTGYFSPPAVTVEPPAGGTAATAVAEVKNGRVTGITVTAAGSGYTAAPVVTINAPTTRTTATATAVVKNGNVTGFTITNGGSGYLAAPAITIPAPTAAPGSATARTPSVRVILHVDDGGTARLLSQVFVGRLADGSDGLCTKEAGLSASNKASASRIVTVHLPPGRVLATGNGSVASGQTLVRTITIPFDDDTNPFVHRYHPDHNNKDARGQPLNAGVESYGITRTFSFQFTAAPPAGVSSTGWGSTRIGGNYTEVIKGLHKQDLTVSGTFVLQRASEIGTLTMQ